MKVEIIKQMMKERNVSVDVISTGIGMDKSTWYRKIKKGGQDFTVKELYGIKEILRMTDEEAIAVMLC